MLTSLAVGSPVTIGLLVACFALVLSFEFSNGFHDTANAVATVIYTNSLKPTTAVVWSGIMNFLGVIAGGIAVAFALVELVPTEVLSPPDGSQAVGMLTSVFVCALIWNVGTWWLAIPNSSSHALIGSLIGITAAAGFGSGHALTIAIDWRQIVNVLGSLLVSPLLGFLLAFLLYKLTSAILHEERAYVPPRDGQAPPFWMRAILLLTCAGVSFSHGTNDGQKSIGLIMLTVIGLMPPAYALNLSLNETQLRQIADRMPTAAELIGRGGGGRRQQGIDSTNKLRSTLAKLKSLVDIPGSERAAVRKEFNQVLAALRAAESSGSLPDADPAKAKAVHDEIMNAVEYAPWWVRILSELCLGLGTMVGYRRIVKTLGERLGKEHLVPAQGASAELIAAGLIGFAGFTGYPVSTTHVVTGGIAGTMVASGTGLRRHTVSRIAWAWVLTLPATITLSAFLFYLLS